MSIAKIKNVADMTKILESRGKPLESFKAGQTIKVSNKMVKKYSYKLEANPGTNFAPDFKPYATPGEMLAMGVFEGKYLNDCTAEFPAEWYIGALQYGRLSPEGPNPVRCNYFGVQTRQPLTVWRENGWAPSHGRRGRTNDHYKGALGDPTRNPDERGWFQWYCRYWVGRRIPELDAIQIRRWRAFRRHAGALRGGCPTWKRDQHCRLRERQALLQWAYNPFI